MSLSCGAIKIIEKPKQVGAIPTNGNNKRKRSHRKKRRRDKNNADQQEQATQGDTEPNSTSSNHCAEKVSPEHSNYSAADSNTSKMPARFEDVLTSGGAQPSTPRRGGPRDLGDHFGANNSPQPFASDVVLSGFSGRLPESSNIDEFKQNLFDGVDMVNEEARRWPSGE